MDRITITYMKDHSRSVDSLEGNKVGYNREKDTDLFRIWADADTFIIPFADLISTKIDRHIK